jgi:nucleoside-diphosphate-sugar epimerase
MNLAVQEFAVSSAASWRCAIRRFNGARIAGIDNFSRPGSRRRVAGSSPPASSSNTATSDAPAISACGERRLGDRRGSAAKHARRRRRPHERRQTVDHNLSGTLNVLEFCKQRGAGLCCINQPRL